MGHAIVVIRKQINNALKRKYYFEDSLIDPF